MTEREYKEFQNGNLIIEYCGRLYEHHENLYDGEVQICDVDDWRIVVTTKQLIMKYGRTYAFCRKVVGA